MLQFMDGLPQATASNNGTTHSEPQPRTGVKHFVLDTNVLLHNPNAIFLLADNQIIIPIDNPYLDSSSNGLSYLVERMKGKGIVGHVTLAKSERSELASLITEEL